jgi:phage-related baseplate assembly protein
LPTTSWRTGDPERVFFKHIAEVLENYDSQFVENVKAGWRSTAEGDWKTVHAAEVYGIERNEASYATPTVTVTNGAGGHYEPGIGDLHFKASSTGKTYTNTDTSDGVLSAGATRTYALIADEAGSDSSVGADEIDEIVAPALLGVTIDSSTAATASDEESDEDLDDRCGDSLGALSPNGPPDAYEYVARNTDLTGVSDVTRARTVSDDDTGEVTVYVASSSGAVAGASVTAVQDAIMIWAKPHCIRPTVVNATPSNVNVVATVEGDDLPGDFEATAEAAIGEELARAEYLSDGTAVVSRSRLIAMIDSAFPDTIVSITLTTPAADVTLASGEVAVVGTVSVTEI